MFVLSNMNCHLKFTCTGTCLSNGGNFSGCCVAEACGVSELPGGGGESSGCLQQGSGDGPLSHRGQDVPVHPAVTAGETRGGIESTQQG